MLGEVISGLKAILVEENKGRGKLFVTNAGWFAIGVLLTVGTIIGTVLASLVAGADESVLFMGIWLTFWSFGCVMLLWMVLKAWKQALTGGGGVAKSVGQAVGITLFASPFFLAEAVVMGILVYNTSIWLLPILVVLVVANAWFFQLLKQPTPAGRRVMDQIEGFRMYLATAEQDSLSSARPPEKTPELFERFLPFALALGVEARWAEQFQDVLARASAAGEQGYRPGWYSGGSFVGGFGAAALAGSIGGAFSSALSSASTAPGSSSGSGGGGSSGGGGGGGGGGGW